MLTAALAFVVPQLAFGGLPKCPPDSALVGPTCVDKYEASVWQIPASNTTLIQRVKKGTATLADLQAGGATQVSVDDHDCRLSGAYPSTFPPNGNWTAPLYAVSLPGLIPSGCTNWFEAAQACSLSGKRLPTNAEWQYAAAGTPDHPDDHATECNTNTFMATPTGSRAKCKSNWGVWDMVGNVAEWVADWTPGGGSCSTWGSFSDDELCFLMGGPATVDWPGALIRGGTYLNDAAGGAMSAGVFSINGLTAPYQIDPALGFRCAR